jgi:hypothetical protein
MPAAYTIGELSTLTCYQGNEPWTDGKLTVFPKTSGPPWVPGRVSCSENWLAFIDPKTSFGMAVFTPNHSDFLAGFSGTHGEGGPTSPNTGYIAGYQSLNVRWNSTISYDFALVLGDLKTIRDYVGAHRHGPP